MEANELIKLLMGAMKRLRVGNHVFFWRLGGISKREVKKKTRREQRAWMKKHPPTREQRAARATFKTNRQLAAHMSKQLHDLGVWRRAVEIFKPERMNSDNYLLHRNHGCMEGGKFKKFRPLIVSLGLLPLPDGMEATREGDSVTLRWLPEAPENDLLHVAIVYDDDRSALVMVNTGYACRGDGTFAFNLTKNSGVVHVYPFFGSEGNKDFTGNDYFRMG